jgi:hypothetical protein
MMTSIRQAMSARTSMPKIFLGDVRDVVTQYGDNTFSTGGMPIFYGWGGSPFDTGLRRKQNYALYGGVGLALVGVNNLGRHLRREKDPLTPEERKKNLGAGTLLAGLGIGTTAVGGELLSRSATALSRNKWGRGILGTAVGLAGVLTGAAATLYGARAMVDGAVGKRPRPVQRTYTYT